MEHVILNEKSDTGQLLGCYEQLNSQTGSSSFEWVDSTLVEAIEKGKWIILENANLANPSVLDRLNSLLEIDTRALSLNEQGLVDGNIR